MNVNEDSERGGVRGCQAGACYVQQKNRDTFLVIFTDLPAVSMLRYRGCSPCCVPAGGAVRGASSKAMLRPCWVTLEGFVLPEAAVPPLF